MNLNMKLRSQGKLGKIISIILLISWLALIFYFSNQKGSTSLSSSNYVIDLLDRFFSFFNANLDIKSLESISFLVRKSAHMFLYFILYFLTYYTMYQFDIKKRKYLSLLVCFFYAVSDEVHQLFIPKRSFGLIDILIDTSGAILASLIIILKSKLNERVKSCKL